MIKYTSLLSLLLVALIINSYGQQPASPPQNLLPKISSGSPEATAFARSGNYEVNLFNGTPNISIPLYEISVGELKVPISINYSASGIRVNDIPTNIGTGWSLSAGGAIARKVNGLPDEYQYNQPNDIGYWGYLRGNTVKLAANVQANTTAGLQYVRHVADNRMIDTEPDIFSYNLSDKSGKFVFNQQNNLNPVFIPYAPLKISHTHPATGMLLSITDEAGIKYDFNDYETDNNNSQPVIGSFISSWLLTKMISSNNQDNIEFKYSSLPNMVMTSLNDNITVTDAVAHYNLGISNPPSGPVYSPSPGQTSHIQFLYNTISQKNLDEIIFRNGKILFELAAEDREDFGMSGLKKRMKKIKIYNLAGNTYNLIKEIEFIHSYFFRTDNNLSKRLRLDRIVIKDVAGVEIQKYQFDYNSYSDNFGLPDKNAKAVDYWGYYNGKFATTLVPRMNITYTPDINGMSQTIAIGASSFGTRDPDPLFMQSGILKKITYPSGGYSQFYFETNQYSPTNLPADAKYAGGLRIKKIESYDGISALPVVKTYVYGQNESGYGLKNFNLDNYFFNTQHAQRYWYYDQSNLPHLWATKSVRTFLTNPNVNIEPYDASPVAYPHVTEYIGDGTSNIGKTVYQFNNTPDGLSILQYQGASVVLTNHFHRGQILYKSVYKRKLDNSYALVTQTENRYSALPDLSIDNIALSVTHNLISEGNFPYSVQGLPPSDQGTTIYNATMEFSFSNYSLRTGDNKLTQTIESVYDQNDPTKVAITTKDLYYDNINHHQVTRTETTNSMNDVIIEYFKYPHEFTQAGNIYQSMVDRNILNKVIEVKKINNSTQTNLQKTNFYNWGNNNFLPQSVQTQVGSNPLETRANFLNYDIMGNIQEMQKTNDIKQSYIWGYNKSYPVAQAVNANSNEIFFDSYEEGNGWDGSLTTYDKFFKHTGLSSGRIDKPTTGELTSHSTKWLTISLTTATKFKYSGWVYSTGPTAEIFLFMKRAGETAYYSYVDAVVNYTTNKWVFVEKEFTVPADVTQLNIRIDNNGGGTVWFDDIRLHPSAATMTTYTYEPLVGMTSQCDVNNRITYYQYDGFGRLILIKDQDKNILKKVCYNYQGQSNDCSLYGNAIKTGTYTKACPSGQTGTQVTYMVPADIYYASTQADADARAQNDVNANGQTYANNNGTCNVSCSISFSSGYYDIAKGISTDGTTVSFYLAFYSYSTMSPGNAYVIGTINGGCKPSADRTLTFSSNGRTWVLVISASGQMTLNMAYGSSMPPYSAIGTPTLNFNL